jgi:hypothetical protein
MRQAWRITTAAGSVVSGFLILWGVGICLPQAVRGQTEAAGASHTAGLVLRAMRWDPVLRRSWAVYWDPAHPERPAVSVPVVGAAAAVEPVAQVAAAVQRPQSVVHAGDQVRLWREERNLRLQLTAIAEENGAVGDPIRLRIPGASWGGMQADQPVRGIVRGTDEVEMAP